jgi:hypothetical protein
VKPDTQRSRTVRRYTGSVLFAAVTFFLMMLGRGGFEAGTRAEFYHLLCDALFVPGILLLCAWLLVFVASDGVFDMLHFGIQKAVRIVLKKEKRDLYPKTFYEYRTMKAAGKKGSTAFLWLPGACLVLGATIALILYMNA